MLRLQTFTFNAFSENTYLIINEKNDCWIVDPGMYDIDETNLFLNYIKENKFIPQAVINTHTHLDHIFGVQACIDQWNLPFLIHEKELPVLKNAAGAAMMFGLDFKKIPAPTSFIKEDEIIMLGSDEIEIRLAPGHSPGSIIFYFREGKWVIGGDVIFNGSIGRTDLPGGNFETLIRSIQTQLFDLPDDTVVYSGHGPATTIGREKLYNPFLQDI